MYDGDSFFTLSAWGQAGLALLSLCLWAGTVGLCLRPVLTSRALRLARAVALLWAFVWLSPQVYYLYYQAIFDGLPWQIVVKAPPGPDHLIRLLTFTEQASLSRHSQGVLGWSLLALSWRSPGSGVKS
ncbi:MAG: hypothetical protein AAF366_18535 [Pseudomonadota bacterium]